MEERGISSIFDLLMLALLVSGAVVLLIPAVPRATGIEEGVHAAACARSSILTLHEATAGDLRYSLGALGLQLPNLSSASRKAGFKTIGELIAEDASLNLRGIGAITGLSSGLNQRMKHHLERIFDNLLGARFAYSFRARVEGGEEFAVENLWGSRELLSVEEARFIVPIPRRGGKMGWLSLDLRLEVWSR